MLVFQVDAIYHPLQSRKHDTLSNSLVFDFVCRFLPDACLVAGAVGQKPPVTFAVP